MSNPIYLLTAGEYSDYHIIGVYSTKELAEEAESLFPDSEIEEKELDFIPEHPPGMKFWYCHIVEGIIKYCGQMSPNNYHLSLSDYYHTGISGDNNGCYYIWAKDEEHATKISLDRWYKHKAQEAGIS
jgi:hypothetical protein